MEQTNILKIFLASPSDVKTERDMIFALKDDIDHLIGKPNKLRFEFINWERSTYPGIGEDAQDVINQNINDDYDIFIGVFWQKFGTPTNRAESGSKEEYDRALRKFKNDPESNHIMLYFKTTPPQNIYELNYSQFEKVKEFREEVGSKDGVYYWEFEKPEDLKNHLLIHLSSLVRDKYSKNISHQQKQEITNGEKNSELNKYELIAKRIDENKTDNDLEGILELMEITTDSMNSLPVISENLTSIILFMGNKFTEKTQQINAINQIKDDRLRIKRATQVVNIMAEDLEEYSEKINENLPEFAETLNEAIDSYTKLIMLASESSFFVDQTKEQIETIVPELYNTLDDAIVQIASFLEILTTMPAFTSKFGKAKRNAELSTNGIFKEFINSKKLLKQLLE